jgi:hypothetical protein
VTYIIPDGHDEDHGNPESRVELREAADLGKAVPVTKRFELVSAELGGDVATVSRQALKGRRRNVNLLAVLDEELGEFVLLEAGDDAVKGDKPSQS